MHRDNFSFTISNKNVAVMQIYEVEHHYCHQHHLIYGPGKVLDKHASDLNQYFKINSLSRNGNFHFVKN